MGLLKTSANRLAISDRNKRIRRGVRRSIAQAAEFLEARRLLSTVIYYADFEDGSGGASSDGFTLDASTTNLWHTSSVRYQSPGYAMYYGQDATRDYNLIQGGVAVANHGAITSADATDPTHQIDLTGQASATLRFRYFLSSDRYFPEDETIKLEVKTDADSTWTELASSATTLTNDAIWHTWTGSLNSYVGNKIQIRYTFDTDEFANAQEGWFLDDIVVYGGTDLPPEVTSFTPAEKDYVTTTSMVLQCTFSEDVTGVDATDLTLSGSAAVGATVGLPTPAGGNNVWNFPISNLKGGLLNATLAKDVGDIVDSPLGQSLLPVSFRYGILQPDIYEPNGDFSSAADLGVIGGTRSFNNMSLDSANDLDFYKFTAEASGPLTLTANYHTNLGPSYTLEMYDEFHVAISDNNTTDDNIFATTIEQGKTYYVKVYSEMNEPLHSYDLTFNTPNIAPRVTAVYVKGSTWTTGFLNYVQTAGLGDSSLGYTVPAGANQLKSLPWTNLNTVSVKFSENVVIDKQDMAMAGINVPSYNVAGSTFTYNATTFVATWQFSSTFGIDKDVVALNADGTSPIVDLGGARLDGEFTTNSTLFPSGNGTEGGNFAFRFNVLPGDVNQGGTVTGTDVILVRNAQLSVPGDGIFSIFKDVNGTGTITGTDVILVRNRQLIPLPSGEPVVPVFA